MSSTVTVVIPTFNGAPFIDAALDSVAAQTYPGVECIVIDDGSSDETVDRARSHPIGARVVEQEHFGVAVARNRGLAIANSDWVGFLDQDDLWQEDRIATLLTLAEDTGSAAVATTESRFAYESDRGALANVGDGRESWPGAWIADGAESDLVGKTPPGATSEVQLITLDRFLEGAAMLTTAVLYDRQTAISAGGCAPHARALDDHVLNVNVARIAGPIPRIDSRQLLYRVHSKSTSTVSPMVAPFLSTQASIRLGGVFSSGYTMGPNLEHLLFNLAKSELSWPEQLALLTLSVPPKARPTWLKRWVARRLGIRR
jgi:glycosyltransferase involved in cell wall biosynthesis